MIMAAIAYNLKKYIRYQKVHVESMANRAGNSILLIIKQIWFILRPYKILNFKCIKELIFKKAILKIIYFNYEILGIPGY